MSRAPRWTICCLVNGQAARVDCDARGEVLHVDPFRSASADGVEFLGNLLAVRRPGRELLLVHDGVWTQTVAIAAAAAAGLDARQLQQALAFEAEPTSNLPAATACTGFRDLGTTGAGARAFWLVQVRQEWIERAATLAALQGARIAGWLHPIGLGLAGADLAEVARVEVGEQVTFCGSLAQPECVIAARAGQRYWQQAVSDWLQQRGDERVLWAGVARPPTAATQSFDDRGALPPAGGEPAAAEWLRWLPGAVLDPAALVPMAASLRVPWRPAARWVGLGLGLLAAAAAWFDDARLQSQAAELVERVDGLKLGAQSARSAHEVQQREIAAIQAAHQANLSSKAELAELESECTRQRGAIVGLLRAVAFEKPVGLQVQSIASTNGGGLRVQGLAVDAAVVDRFAARLADAVRGRGGSVQPAESRRRALDGHDVFGFTVVVVAGAGPVTPAVAPKRRSS